jgi:hypothetical protein
MANFLAGRGVGMNAKQTGPAGTVKGSLGHVGLRRAVALSLALALGAALSGCAGGWTHPSKTLDEVRADEAQCNQEAEDDSRLRAGASRADRAPPGGPTAGSLGPSPMEMRDRDRVTQDFHNGYDACMESKGYTKGKPKS